MKAKQSLKLKENNEKRSKINLKNVDDNEID
jgi:hypothetical protein